MPITANVTNEQITASVGETQIDVTVSGGIGPTGPAGAGAGAITFSTVTDTSTYTNFNTTPGSLATALSGIDSALDGKAAANHASQHATGGSDAVDGLLDNWGIEWDATTSYAGGYVRGTIVTSAGSVYVLASDNTSPSGQDPGDVSWPKLTQVVVSVAGKSGAVTLDAADVGASSLGHAHSASDVTSGTLDIARIPTGTTSTTVCIGNDARLSDARTPTAHNHAASDINSGVLATARLASSGTASASTYLRGDQSWSSIPAGGSTNVWIPASAFIPRTTNGCGVDSRETSTNRTNWDELLFDAGADEFAQAAIVMPSNYNAGTFTARFYWTASGATDGSDDVIWGIQARAFANDDALDTAFGTAQTVTDTVIATNDMHVSSATSAVTAGGTPAANVPLLIQIYRDADAAGDTYGHDARLLGVEIIYTAA